MNTNEGPSRDLSDGDVGRLKFAKWLIAHDRLTNELREGESEHVVTPLVDTSLKASNEAETPESFINPKIGDTSPFIAEGDKVDVFIGRMEGKNLP